MLAPRHRRFATGLTLTLALTGVAAACGDDDDQADGAPTAASVSLEACDAFTALGGALAGDPSGAEAVIAAFEESAPADLSNAAGALAGAYRELAGGGAPTAFGEPGVVTASAEVADAYFDGCDLSATLDVAGVDFGFEGIPETIDAGRVGIRFTNETEHDEAHELVLFKRLPGADEPVAELLALPEEESMRKVEMAGVVFADRPQQEAVTMLDLDAGKYVAVCFIPVGGGEDGPPHFASGMVAEFEAS